MWIKKILKNLSPNKIIDFLVINFSLFVLFFAWIRFITKSIYHALVISLLLLVGYNLLGYYIKKSKMDKKNILETRKRNIESCVISLLSLDKSEINELFSNQFLAQKNNKNQVKSIFIKKDEENVGISYYFETLTLSLEYAIKIVRQAVKEGLNKIIIFCCDCKRDDELKLLGIQNIKVEIYKKENVYETLFENKNIIIENEINFSSPKKMKFKDYFSHALTKDKSKKYFFSGLLIFFASLIVRHNFYYIIMSSLLFMLAILSRREFSWHK